MSLRIGKYKSTSTGIDVSHLNNIIKIDKIKKSILVEPNCTMG